MCVCEQRRRMCVVTAALGKKYRSSAGFVPPYANSLTPICAEYITVDYPCDRRWMRCASEPLRYLSVVVNTGIRYTADVMRWPTHTHTLRRLVNDRAERRQRRGFLTVYGFSLALLLSAAPIRDDGVWWLKQQY